MEKLTTAPNWMARVELEKPSAVGETTPELSAFGDVPPELLHELECRPGEVLLSSLRRQ